MNHSVVLDCWSLLNRTILLSSRTITFTFMTWNFHKSHRLEQKFQRLKSTLIMQIRIDFQLNDCIKTEIKSSMKKKSECITPSQCCMSSHITYHLADTNAHTLPFDVMLAALFFYMLIIVHFIDNTMENDWIIFSVVIRKSFYSFSLCVLLVIICLQYKLATIYRFVIRFYERKNQISVMFFSGDGITVACTMFIVAAVTNSWF